MIRSDGSSLIKVFHRDSMQMGDPAKQIEEGLDALGLLDLLILLVTLRIEFNLQQTRNLLRVTQFSAPKEIR